MLYFLLRCFGRFLLETIQKDYQIAFIEKAKYPEIVPPFSILISYSPLWIQGASKT
jgi:hypothetical protein